MKHIGAILGSPETYYTKKFAWIPTRLKNKSYVWFTTYVEKEISWRWHPNAPVVAIFNISVKEAMLEGLKQIKHETRQQKTHYEALEDDYMGRD